VVVRKGGGSVAIQAELLPDDDATVKKFPLSDSKSRILHSGLKNRDRQYLKFRNFI
jgi:hypothetical protein